jgi:NAD(P)H dehydrogenase (quinone)
MITVAGGTGQVGKPLTQGLVHEGEQVWVLTRDPEAARTAFGDARSTSWASTSMTL